MLFIGLPEMLRCDCWFVDVLWFPLWLLLLCCGDMSVGDCGPDEDCCGLFFHGWKPFPTAASANGGGDLFDNLLHWAASIASGVPFKPGCSWKGNSQTLIYVSVSRKVSFTCWELIRFLKQSEKEQRPEKKFQLHSHKKPALDDLACYSQETAWRNTLSLPLPR